MIAVTFALPAESSAFVRKLKRVTHDGMIVRGELGHQTSNINHQTSPICVIHSGVGSRECEKRLRSFLEQNRPELIVSSGFCGGAIDELKPGDLVVAENYSAENLLIRARELLPTARVGSIFSAEQVVDPAADRYAIGREHGAVAIDMETATIAQFAREKKIPMISLRVVSDSPAAPFPLPPHIVFDVAAQKTKFSRLLGYLAVQPAAIARLAQFSKQVSFAKTRLADALITVIEAANQR